MNGWLRDFFHKNAWGIMLFIGGLIATLAVMRSDVQSVLAVAPKVYELEKKQYAQEEVNKIFEKALDRIETKLDRALRK